MKSVVFVLFFLCLGVNDVFSQHYKLKTIVIDAGHGGKDPGCQGSKTLEKNIALSVVKKLNQLIKAKMKDVKVIMTRTDDTFVALHERANIANKNKADLFISIHCNASPVSSRFGSETYTMGLHVSNKNKGVANRENKVILEEKNYLSQYEGFDPNSPQGNIVFSLLQNASMENSISLAEKVESQFKNKAKRHSLGVKQAGFIVLWMTSCPSILIEIGFLTNKREEAYLSKGVNQDKIALSIFYALLEYKLEVEG